jgi:hypothetical protein
MIGVGSRDLTPDSAAAQPPDGIPELQAGAHLSPEDGACLMEYVSVLSGAPFSDHPRCTDPTLGAVARLVNDSCSDARRPMLTTFAPLLAAAPPVDACRTVAIVRAVVRTASGAVDGTALRPRLRRVERRHERVRGDGRMAAVARRLDPLYRRGPGRHHLEASVAALHALPEPQRDAALIAALTAALSAAGAAAPAVARPGPLVLDG